MTGVADHVTRTAHPPSSTTSNARLYVAIFLIALAARAGWGLLRLLSAEDPLALEFPDEKQYWLMATSLWSGGGLVDEFGFRATRMPLFPGLLSLFAGLPSGVVWAKVFQWLVGAAAAPLAAALAGRLFSRTTAWIAGVMVAIDPFLIFFSSLLLSETVSITCLLALMVMLVSARADAGAKNLARWCGVGAVAALCVYARESHLGLVVVLLIYALVRTRFQGRSIGGVLLVVCVVVAALFPWALRNRQTIGEWCWLTTRGGVSLYDGVRPGATGASDLAGVQDAPEVRDLSEVEWNRHFLRASYSCIRAEPGRMVRLVGIKLARTWNPIPNADTYRGGLVRIVSTCWTVPVFAFALLGAIMVRWDKSYGGFAAALWLLLPALYFAALHTVFVGSVRYRLPAMPMLEVLAAVAITELLRRAAAAKTRNA